MHLGNADRIMRQHLEEAEHECRGRHAAQRQRRRAAVLADGLAGHAGGEPEGTRRRGIAEDDLGAIDDAGFDMHDSLLLRTHRAAG